MKFIKEVLFFIIILFVVYGDVNVINGIFKYFEYYIICFLQKILFDEYGNFYIYVEEEIK